MTDQTRVLEDARAFDEAYWRDPKAWYMYKAYRRWHGEGGETPRVASILDGEQWLEEAPDFSLEYLIDKCWAEIKRRHGGVHAQRSLVKSMEKLLDDIAFGVER